MKVLRSSLIALGLAALVLQVSAPAAMACSTISGALKAAVRNPGDPYNAGCSAAVAFHIPSGHVYPGTCTGTTYSIPSGSETDGFYIVQITWAAGTLGTPANQPAQIVRVQNGAGTCPNLDFTAVSGPNAIGLDSFGVSSGKASIGMVLLALLAVFALLVRRQSLARVTG